MAKRRLPKTVTTIRHKDSSRKNIPTAEHQPLMREEDQAPVPFTYARRNHDLDPQLVWRGKDEQDWSDLVVQAPPLYIQEKIHPKVLIDDLVRRSEEDAASESGFQTDLFADFNGLPSEDARTEFYQHEANWSNRMILGDGLQVMASLAEREGLRGKVQCIYIDPPYGIKFNSNFQWSTTSRNVTDGKAEHITREPEQVKAFRDTWRDGIHSYLTYLRERLTVARDLLTESGSIFVQIGDENVHRVRAVMDEVFGERNFVSQIAFSKTSGQTDSKLAGVADYLLWFSKNYEECKVRSLKIEQAAIRSAKEIGVYVETDEGIILLSRKHLRGDIPIPKGRIFRSADTTSATGSTSSRWIFSAYGQEFSPSGRRGWSTNRNGMHNLLKAGRLFSSGRLIRWKNYHDENAFTNLNNLWTDVSPSGFGEDRIYVVQTLSAIIERCILMTTDPGDLVLDPTCGSGTTAYVAEQWGRRWITIDTSRVALALARARIMGARYPYYLLADSAAGQIKEAEIERKAPSESPTYGNIRQGFVCERVPHITLKSIANNIEIDVIWEKFQEKLEPLRQQLNEVLDKKWDEWEIPREADEDWPDEVRELHADWWKQRIARQKEIDASIAAKADYEYLYDKPYEDSRKVRVAGPFTVESISPHRVLTVDENDEFIEDVEETKTGYDFAQVILENLKTAGVQQAHKEDGIAFTYTTPWPGEMVCAEGRYAEGATEKRAGIFVGPEFGTVSRPDLVQAAREAADAGFDVLVACAFNYDAHATDFDRLGRIPVLKARMNADLHMADDLKNTGKGNLFVIFGEPDIDILDAEDEQIQVKVNGVDVFHPNTGEVRSDGPEGIACWFIDTDYNEESFFVRHAYFLGASDPYKSLKTTLKAEINTDAWATLKSDTSCPFNKPESGRIAVKVINHLGDEVMKVFRV